MYQPQITGKRSLSIDLFAGIGGIRRGFDNAFGESIETVFVVFHFLVVLGKQLLSGLVGSSGNSRAALASLDDADFQMWYWHLWLNLLRWYKKRPILFSTVRHGDIHLLSGNDCFQSFLGGKSTKGQLTKPTQGKCSFLWMIEARDFCGNHQAPCKGLSAERNHHLQVVYNCALHVFCPQEFLTDSVTE